MNSALSCKFMERPKPFGMRAKSAWQSIPYVIMAIFFVRSLLLLWMPPPYQNERLWLEWLGGQVMTSGAIPHQLGAETLGAAGAPWTPQEWLFGLFLAWCARHRLDLLPIVTVAALATVPLIVTCQRLRNRRADDATLILAVTILALAMSTTLQMRATICAFAAASVVFAVLPCRDSRQYTIPIIVAALANLHAMAIFLAGLPSLTLFATILEERAYTANSRRLIIVSVASLAASFCTPFGFALHRYTFSLALGHIHRYVSEWTPLLRDLSNPPVAILACLAIILILLIAAWWRESPLGAADTALLLVTGVLMLDAERFAPLFIIAAAPVALTRGLRTPGGSAALLRSPLLMTAFAMMVVGAGSFGVVHHVLHDPSIELAARPGFRLPPAWLEPSQIGQPSRERVFCSDFTLCNPYLWAGARDVLDGRFDPFPLSSFTLAIRINGTHPGWQDGLNRLRLNVVVVKRGTEKLERAMRALPGWHEAVSDAEATTFVRKTL
jgi:hypothetical protein